MLRNLLSKFSREKQPTPASPAASTAPDASAAAARVFAEGRRELAAGNQAQAELCFRQALDLQHDFGAAHVALGDVMAASGRADDALDCYQLAVHFSPGLGAAHVALGAALLGRQRYAEAEAECRAALTLEPASSAAWFCLGNVLKARGDLEPAAAAYREAVRVDPANVDALQQLAFVEFRHGRYDEAYRTFGLLLAAAPASPNAHHNLGLLQLETGYAEAALANFRRALELQPGTAETMACIGHALRDLARFDEAIAAYDAALALQPEFGDALSNRSQTMLMRGDYGAGWRQYEQRFAASGTRARSAGAPPWQDESLAGRSIAVLSEQGIGDEIMFASCLPDLLAAAGQVVIECEPRLAAIFARSFTQASVRARDGAAPDGGLRRPDCEISIGSLPLHFRSSRASFPRTAGYLRADAAKVARWRNRHAAGGQSRRIGLAWRGGTLRNRQYLRSLDLSELVQVLRQPGCEFVSLQYGDRRDELRALSDRAGIVVHDFSADIGEDIDELAAVIDTLDLVVTVDNTIAHLAGALGKPTWILLPYSPEWRYGRDGESMAWYPSARLFRQVAPRDWSGVVARVAQALAGDA